MNLRTRASIAAISLLGSACIKDEQDIDRTVVTGTVVIPARASTERETEVGQNDTLDVAEAMGELRYAQVTIQGQSLRVGNTRDGEPREDPDWYTLEVAASGTLEAVFAFPYGTGDTGEDAPARHLVQLFDASTLDADGNPTLLAEADTASDSTQAAVLSAEVAKGTVLAIAVTAGAGGLEMPEYSIQLSGLDPNGAGIQVGAYEGGNWETRGALLGGTTTGEFLVDASTGNKSAEWTLYGVSKVETNETETTVTLVDQAYFWAGTFGGLNGGISSGMLYSGTPIQVPLQSEKIVGVNIVVDSVVPVIIGWETSEAEPNDVEIDGNYAIVGGAAQPAPEASGPGYTDIIRGTIVLETDDPGWGGDNDAYTITVPSTMGMIATLSWSDPERTLDLNWNGPGGEWWGAGWAILDTNPERFDTVTDFATYLEPGEEHTLVVLAWDGPAGSVDYELRLEWAAP